MKTITVLMLTLIALSAQAQNIDVDEKEKVKQVCFVTGAATLSFGFIFLGVQPGNKRDSQAIGYTAFGTGISLNIAGVLAHFKRKRDEPEFESTPAVVKY